MAVIVPVYDSLGPEAAECIVNRADAKYIFSSEHKYKNALELVDKCESVEKLIFSHHKSLKTSLRKSSVSTKS